MIRIASPRRRPRLLALLTPLVLVLLGGAGPFEGCDDTGGGEPRPLPRDTSEGCFFDSDCVPAGCELLRCIAGTCAEVAPIRDQDGDGEAPAPCGMDCDDMDPSIGTGQTELCDLIDQDCDDRIDEMAVPRALRFDLPTMDATMTMASWGEQVVVSDAVFTRRGVRVRRVELDGELGTVEPLLDSDREIVRVSAHETEDGAWFAVALEEESPGDGQEIVLVRTQRGAEGMVELVGEPARRAAIDVQALAVIAIGEVVVVGWDEADTTRSLWSPAWADAVVVGDGLVAGLGSLDLATDGTSIVVPAGPHTLAFHAPADGARTTTQETTGDVSVGRPLASADGFVWALVRDAFDHSIQRVDASAAGLVSTLPTGGGLELGVDVTPEGLVLTRAGSEGVRAWVLEETNPTAIRRTFSPGDISGPVRPIVTTDVAVTSQGTAILTNYGAAGSSLAVIACGME
ncbi:MAG: putative metal-binding motif-containing protein [Myxococcota bacterium]|nr:putative metal-binding motif-containing protein [Myxococcota bacterium]